MFGNFIWQKYKKNYDSHENYTLNLGNSYHILCACYHRFPTS